MSGLPLPSQDLAWCLPLGKLSAKRMNASQVGGPEQGHMRRGQNLRNGSQQQHERGVRKDSSYSRGCAGTTEADLSQNEARAISDHSHSWRL